MRSRCWTCYAPVPDQSISVAYLPLTFINNAPESACGAAEARINQRRHHSDDHDEDRRDLERDRPASAALHPARCAAEIEEELRQGVLSPGRTGCSTAPAPRRRCWASWRQITEHRHGRRRWSRQIFDAIGKVENAGGVVDAIVMNPPDYCQADAGRVHRRTPSTRLIQGERFGQYRIVRTRRPGRGHGHGRRLGLGGRRCMSARTPTSRPPRPWASRPTS